MPKRLARSGESEDPAPDLDVRELGRLVRQERLKEQLSIRQAALRAHVSFSTLSRVEAGAQPDLATFMSLCAWLGVDAARFFSPITRRAPTQMDEAIEHIVTDPTLSPEAADRIVAVVRDLYGALARQVSSPSPEPLAVHLRAAAALRPGAPERLALLLRDMREALEQSAPA